MSTAPIGTPPFTGMHVGMNAAWINTWSGAWVFANLMYHAELPDQTVGSGSYTYNQGLLTASVPTDRFRIKLADNGNYLPQGTYTVLNPDGLKVAISGWNNPGSGWTTATEFTFAVQSWGSSSLCLHVEGSITANTGNLAVILPGHLDSWRAGNVWNSQFLSFHTAMNTRVVRTMDWTWASQNIETEWSERSRPNGITLRTPCANGASVPYEFMCDLASRLNTEIWVCVPPRANVNYREQMAQLFATHYPSGKALWLEYGNEIWNSASPWGEGTSWVTYLDFTKRTATADVANQKFILPNHGLSNGQRVIAFATAENRNTRITLNWRFNLGCADYVKVIDANSFELYDTAALTTRLTVTTGMVNLMFVVDSEVGKVANQHVNFSNRCLSTWDIFDSRLGVARVKRLLSSQAGNVSVTTSRVAVPTVLSRASYLTIAPYFDGAFFGGEVVASTGQLLPKFWATASSNVYMNVYPANASPSVQDQILGTGAINHQLLAYTAGSSSYTNMTAVTGLTNGTSYKVFFLYEEGSLKRQAVVSATPSVGGSIVTAYPTVEDQAQSNALAANVSSNAIRSHLAAGGLPLVCYEGGIHYHHSKPAALSTWLNSYFETPEFADVNRRYLIDIAETGCKLFCHYGDSLGTNFSIANGYHDVDDRRYKVFTGFKGRVPRSKKLAALTIPNINVGNILNEPAYPYTVHTFSDASLTYKIIAGDDRNNFVMSGNRLQLANGTGINWNAPVAQSITLSVSDGNIIRQFNVTLGLGNAWYEADSLFAWSSVDDDDTTQINPAIGSPLAIVEGTPATLVGDMFALAANGRYGSATALTSTVTATKPILWAFVLDKAAQPNGYKFIVRNGSGNFMSAYVNWDVSADFRANGNVSTVSNAALRFAASTPAGAHVYWIFFDPATSRLYAGTDQVPNGYVPVSYGSGSSTFGRELFIGGQSVAGMQSSMKHGSVQIINRENMTMNDALAIVAKMQAHHGIA